MDSQASFSCNVNTLRKVVNRNLKLVRILSIFRLEMLEVIFCVTESVYFLFQLNHDTALYWADKVMTLTSMSSLFSVLLSLCIVLTFSLIGLHH